MKYRVLGDTDIGVSAICLGTMTWGGQNTEREGHRQMDYALDQGVTFWDTAELYAVPPKASTYGKTEKIIGSWFKTRGSRDRIVIASKVVGYAPHMRWIRQGGARLDRENIVAALDASLRRMGIDYIDLYQLHWPDRVSPRFGARYYQHGERSQATPIEETLGVLEDLIAAGKIRWIGVSNETPWGTMRFLTGGKERIVSIQNPYNLLNRTFESGGLAEIAHRERCGLLAYSPLGGGVLSGKYLNGARPPGSRYERGFSESRYNTPNAIQAVTAYVDLARKYGLDPAELAIAFTLKQPFLVSCIIGATSMEQLKVNIGSVNIDLSSEILDQIEQISALYPDPCP